MKEPQKHMKATRLPPRVSETLQTQTPRKFWEPSAEFKARMAERRHTPADTSEDEFEELWDNVPV